MLAALPSCRAEISSTPHSTSACEILKLAVPSRPKHRRAPYGGQVAGEDSGNSLRSRHLSSREPRAKAD